MKNYVPPTNEELRALLKRNKLTVEEAARLVGLSKTHIRDHLLNINPMPAHAWITLSSHLEQQDS